MSNKKKWFVAVCVLLGVFFGYMAGNSEFWVNGLVGVGMGLLIYYIFNGYVGE